MDYSRILNFKGTWRNYQARVLKNIDKYIENDRIHIVAAPGSGKTTLGIELIKRLQKPALVLAPSITIREQWVSRIVEGFLTDGLNPNDYISQNLKDPRVITIVTYQSLHSAMNKYKGILKESGSDDAMTDTDDIVSSKTEDVDFSDFNLIKLMKDCNLGVICLDECHHLRSEWWKALEDFKEKIGNLKVIALTATPPYDSTPQLWERYMNMCGEIDEEIAIPELVKEGSLCPHQDFVYFNYPTEEENFEVEKFHSNSKKIYTELLADSNFATAIKTHKALTSQENLDELLENPNHLSALLIYLQAKGIPFPAHLQRLLGAKKLPDMSPQWMETLLQGFLYDNADFYGVTKEYRQFLEDLLKTNGLIEKKKVNFVTNPKVEKMLITSKGKCNSIRDIVRYEYQSLQKELRLLILTDYIRKEYINSLGDSNADVTSLGAIPFFEQLRRQVSIPNSGFMGLQLGVLCGTVVIIPAYAKEQLLNIIGTAGKITFQKLGSLSETEYIGVQPVGDNHFLTSAITELFTQGYMQVLIGTKSLLGEGWDSPCINSLILASFVGSFMLSNQMRGRAIRVMKNNPNKTSNIWHLVSLASPLINESHAISEDFTLLQRRMEHFLGLHYDLDIITNGIERLSVIGDSSLLTTCEPAYVEQINQKMLLLSANRQTLYERWMRSLVKYQRMDMVEETLVPKDITPKFVYKKYLGQLVAAGLAFALFGLAGLFLGGLGGLLCKIAMLISTFCIIRNIPRVLSLSTASKRLFGFGKGLLLALNNKGMMEESNCKVVTEDQGTQHSIYLSGGTEHDKKLFHKCVKEMFAPIENQRYLLVNTRQAKGEDSYFSIPDCFAKRKEDAQMFYECIRKCIGEYDLIYTRNEAGRKVLLEGRLRSMANNKRNSTSRKKLTELD